MTTKGM